MIYRGLLTMQGEDIPGNKMDSNNLATLFAPNILHSMKTTEGVTSPGMPNWACDTLYKRLAIFPFPAVISLTKLYLAGNKLFPARESLVCDITAGDGKIGNLFYSVWRCDVTRNIQPRVWRHQTCLSEAVTSDFIQMGISNRCVFPTIMIRFV